ncbi:AAA family ATPase [Planotetraspora thailandica]
MPDEVDIAVSAVTSATLAAATSSGASAAVSPQAAPPAEREAPSPYPQDPWSLVPSEPASGALFRNAVDSMYGSAPADVNDDEAAPAKDSGTDERNGSGVSGGSSGLGAFGDGKGFGADGAGAFGSDGPGAFGGNGPGAFGGDGPGAFGGDGPGAFGAQTDAEEGPATSEIDRSAVAAEADKSTGAFDAFGTAFRSPAPAAPAEEDAGGPAVRDEGDKDGPVAPPAFGGFGTGAFAADSPSDTDSYNLGAFAEADTRKITEVPEPAAEEPLRGWLEPAVPVEKDTPAEPPAASEHDWPSSAFDTAAAAPERTTGEYAFPVERTGENAFPAERTTGEHAFPVERSLEDTGPADPFGLNASAPFRVDRTPSAADTTFRVTNPDSPFNSPVDVPVPAAEQKPEPAKDDPFSGSLRDDLAVEQRKPQEAQSSEEPPPYQPRRRQSIPTPAFNTPSRTAGGSKPSADSLDPVSLLKGRRNAPKGGWRRLVYKASAGWIKPGEPPEVRRRRELINRARTPVASGHHRVAVLSLKGGVGKTTTTVGLGATLAQIRGDRVIAVDANPDRGTLSDKVELETAATVRDLLNERGQIKRYVDIRAFTSQAPSRLEILASDRDPSVSEAFSAKDYHAVSQVLENFYSICITDCGTGLLHSAMSGVLGLADQIVLISSPSVDGARAASATLDWLEAHHYEDLVRAATVVLCSVRPRSKSTVDLDRLEAHFTARCRAVIRVPYDPHLEEGAEIDLEQLQEATRDAYLKLAASVGDGFAGPQALGERRFSEIPDQL